MYPDLHPPPAIASTSRYTCSRLHRGRCSCRRLFPINQSCNTFIAETKLRIEESFSMSMTAMDGTPDSLERKKFIRQSIAAFCAYSPFHEEEIMAVHFNEASVAADAFGVNAARQRLLTEARVSGTNIHLDRWTLRAGGTVELDVPGKNLAWFQMLEGEATFLSPGGELALTRSHIAFLPPGFKGTLTSGTGAVLLYAEVPDAGRFDANFAAKPPQLRVVDWTREPVLDSEHDARKRIYVVTPKLFGTRAIKGEMIIYPPDTRAANHHHEGAEHFMFLLQGRATAYANEQPMEVRAGDVCYFHDRERHF